MQRWACGVSYLGGHYHGWQKQPYLKSTVEQVLTEAVSEIADAPVELTCAGRTDKGVHALGQVIHFDAPKARTALNWLQGVTRNCRQMSNYSGRFLLMMPFMRATVHACAVIVISFITMRLAIPY